MTHLRIVVPSPAPVDLTTPPEAEITVHLLQHELEGLKAQRQRLREAVDNLNAHADAIRDDDPRVAAGITQATALVGALLGPIGLALDAPIPRAGVPE